MYNHHRIILLLLILAITIFNNVALGQRNNEIYNLEAKWEKTEANYKRDLEASKEKLRDFENKLREARQEERTLVANGATERSSDFSLAQNSLVEVRKWIGILEESIAFEKGNIRRIEELLNNGRQDLEFMKQQIKRRMEEEAKRQREAKEAEAKRQREEEQKQAAQRKKKQQEKEMKEAAERQRKQEEARQRAEEERRRAEEARRRAEEERRRREEERRRKYEMEYNREMARTEESFRRNIANADMQKQNMEYLRNEKIDNIEIKSGYIPSSSNSAMTAQKRSKEGILPKKGNNVQKIDLTDEINAFDKLLNKYSNTNTNIDYGY